MAIYFDQTTDDATLPNLINEVFNDGYLTEGAPPTPGTNSTRSAKLTGTNIAINDERSAKIRGSLSSNSTRSAKITGDNRRFWVGGTGSWNDDTNHWALSSGGLPNTGNLPSYSNSVVIDENSGLSGGTLSVNSTVNCIDFTSRTAYSYTLAVVAGGDFGIKGSLELESGITFTDVGHYGAITFTATTTGKTIDIAGVVLPLAIVFSGVGGGWTLLNDIEISYGNLIFDNGTFNADIYDVIAVTVAINRSTTHSPTILMGSGIWQISSSWTVTKNLGGTLTIIPETSTIKLVGSGGTISFNGGGELYNDLLFSGATGSIFSIGGSNTFNDFTVDSSPQTLKFEYGSTTTIVNDPDISGTPGNLNTLNTSYGKTSFNLSKSSGVINCDYLDISYSNAIGGAQWYAGEHSLNTIGNDGWLFNGSDERYSKIYSEEVVTSIRDAKTTGKSTNNAERSSNLIGNISASSDRNSKLTGIPIPTNSEIQAKITGKSNVTDERSSKVSGKILIDDSRQSYVIGKQSTSAIRDSNIIGKQSTSSESDVQITGKELTSSIRDSKVTGMDVSGSERSSKIIGLEFDSSERNSNILGKENIYEERQSNITGKNGSSVGISAKLNGKAIESTTRDAKILGQENIQSERQSVIGGQSSTSSEIDSRVIGNLTTDDSKSAKLRGFNLSDSNRDVILIGKALSNDERLGVIHGKENANNDRSVSLFGKKSSFSEIFSKVSGIISASSERFTKLIGKQETQSEHDALIFGKIITTVERLVKLIGKDNKTSDRTSKLRGKDLINSSRQSEIAGKKLTLSQRFGKLIGKANTSSNRLAKVAGTYFAYNEISSRITGGLGTQDSRQAKLRGKIIHILFKTINVGIKLLRGNVSIKDMKGNVSIKKLETKITIEKQ